MSIAYSFTSCCSGWARAGPDGSVMARTRAGGGIASRRVLRIASSSVSGDREGWDASCTTRLRSWSILRATCRGEEILPVEAAPRDAQHPGYRTSRPLKRFRRDGMVRDGQQQSRVMLHAIPLGMRPADLALEYRSVTTVVHDLRHVDPFAIDLSIAPRDDGAIRRRLRRLFDDQIHGVRCESIVAARDHRGNPVVQTEAVADPLLPQIATRLVVVDQCLRHLQDGKAFLHRGHVGLILPDRSNPLEREAPNRLRTGIGRGSDHPDTAFPGVALPADFVPATGVAAGRQYAGHGHRTPGLGHVGRDAHEGAPPRHGPHIDLPTVEPLLDSLEARPRGAIHELRRAHEGHQGRVEYAGHEQPILHGVGGRGPQKERTEQAAKEDPESPGTRPHLTPPCSEEQSRGSTLCPSTITRKR